MFQFVEIGPSNLKLWMIELVMSVLLYSTSIFTICVQVIHCGLVYDIIRRLVETLTERNIELLLTLLKSELPI